MTALAAFAPGLIVRASSISIHNNNSTGLRYADEFANC
jgi:hypothetical protein